MTLFQIFFGLFGTSGQGFVENMFDSIILKKCREQGIIPSSYGAKSGSVALRVKASSAPEPEAAKSEVSKPKAPADTPNKVCVAAVQAEPSVETTPEVKETPVETPKKCVASPVEPSVEVKETPAEIPKKCAPAAASPVEPSVEKSPEVKETPVETPKKCVAPAASPVEPSVEKTPEVKETPAETPKKCVPSPVEPSVETSPEVKETPAETPKKVCVAAVEPPAPTKKVCGKDATMDENQLASHPGRADGGDDGGDTSGDSGADAGSNGSDDDAGNGTDGSAGGGGGGDGDEEYVFGTAPFDPRFPNTNQTKHCGVSFIDYHRCTRLHGEGHEPCNYFKKVFTSICPNKWIEKWNEQIEAGTYPVKLDP